jgi:hypothetical protein
MSQRINFDISSTRVGYIDPGVISTVDVRQDSRGGQRVIHRSSKYGLELGAMDIAVPRIANHLMEQARQDGSAEAQQYSPTQARRDAEDFASSTLTQILSPAENVRRGEDKPYMFVRSRGPELIPSRQTLDIGANASQYQVRAPTGQAQWTNLNDLSALQNADSVGDVMNYGAHWYGIAYQVSIPETWSQKFTRLNIQTERSDAAVLGLDDFQESVSSWGDATKQVTGAFTMGNAPLIIGGTAFHSGATAQAMVLAIGSWEAMFKRANGGRKPTGGVMPTSDMVALKNTVYTNTGVTAWSNAIQSYPWLANMVESDNLELGNADSNGPRWVLFGRDDMKLHMEHTDTMVFGPFVRDLTTYFYLIRRHGGLIAKMPEMVFYIDFTLG